MHTIEPFYNWRDLYAASEDENSPYFGKEYNEFSYSNTIYNYYIHPQWDEFGSTTMYLKVLYADYEKGFAVVELIGEWNDAITNDIMLLKENLIDQMSAAGVNKFIFIGENVLIFHRSDDCYYEAIAEDLGESGGWMAMLNFREHVIRDMEQAGLGNYLRFIGDGVFSNWRAMDPEVLAAATEHEIMRASLQSSNDPLVS